MLSNQGRNGFRIGQSMVIDSGIGKVISVGEG